MVAELRGDEWLECEDPDWNGRGFCVWGFEGVGSRGMSARAARNHGANCDVAAGVGISVRSVGISLRGSAVYHGRW